MEKRIQSLHDAPAMHWVGNGFPVRTLLSYNDHGRALDPFLLLDYAAPTVFAPTERPRGVGVHPHRGFETVTIALQGEVAHRDSTGAGGVIGPGDVQWMTAASGILHEEFHSPAFTAQGGTLEMVQLWVNLPAKHKLAPAAYQNLRSPDIPVVDLPNSAGHLRLIAGQYAGHSGPARTFTPIQLWEIHLQAGAHVHLPAHSGYNLGLVLLRGSAHVAGAPLTEPGQLAVLEPEGDELLLQAQAPATLLWLAGEPINEPVVGHGPFVMNSESEIRQAFADMRSGQFGRWRAGAA